MQVSVFGFNWVEVCKRPNAETIVDEMILTDDVDLYATYLPDDMWLNDSASLHFSIVEVGLDHKSAQGQPLNVGLSAQVDVLKGIGDSGTERGGRIYDQGRGSAKFVVGSFNIPTAKGTRCCQRFAGLWRLSY